MRISVSSCAIVLAGVSVVLAAGCQGEPGATAPIPGAQGTTQGAVRAINKPSEIRAEGVFSTWLANYDGLGLAQVRFSIDRSQPSLSYIVVYPFPPKGKGPHFKKAYYRAPLVLSTYVRDKDGTITVDGGANLGTDLGRFRFSGILGKAFQVLYHDARGEGTFVARYIRPAHKLPDDPFSIVRASATPVPVIGSWVLTLGGPCGGVACGNGRGSYSNSTFYVFIRQAQVASADSFGNAIQVDFSGLMNDQSAPDPYEAKYLSPFSGVWIAPDCQFFRSTCSLGDWQVSSPDFGCGILPYGDQDLNFGSELWEPPSASTGTAGSWLASVGGLYGLTPGSNYVTIAPTSVPSPGPAATPTC
jgi:hypothetical protein